MIVDKKKLIWGVNLGLVGVAMVLAWIFGPSLMVEAKYQSQITQQAGKPETFSGRPVAGFGTLMYSMTGFEEILEDDSLMTPVSPYFGLVIPKVFINVGVTEEVNPADSDKYQEVLRQAGGVAHAAGTAVPGEPGTIYIFGHSTDAGFNVARYNAVFYLLRKLEAGDLITAYYKSQPYNYTVVEKKGVDSTDLTDIINVDNEERLVLQTCWPPGTNWKRFLIVAEPDRV